MRFISWLITKQQTKAKFLKRVHRMKKLQEISEAYSLAALLTLSGGFMDAYSYICRDQVFANAQTGNMLLFGINLSTGNISSALRYLFPVMAFAFGIAVTEIIRNLSSNKSLLHWRQIILAAEALILLSVAFMPQSLNLLANSLISFACGFQVQSFQKVNGSGIATTMCIGNLRAAVQATCEYGFSKNKIAKESGFLYFSIIGIFIIGAILGNFCVGMWQERAIVVSVVLLLAGFLFMHIKRVDRNKQMDE